MPPASTMADWLSTAINWREPAAAPLSSARPLRRSSTRMGMAPASAHATQTLRFAFIPRMLKACMACNLSNMAPLRRSSTSGATALASSVGRPRALGGARGARAPARPAPWPGQSRSSTSRRAPRNRQDDDRSCAPIPSLRAAAPKFIPVHGTLVESMKYAYFFPISCIYRSTT